MQFQQYVLTQGWNDAIFVSETNFIDAVKGFMRFRQEASEGDAYVRATPNWETALKQIWQRREGAGSVITNNTFQAQRNALHRTPAPSNKQQTQAEGKQRTYLIQQADAFIRNTIRPAGIRRLEQEARTRTQNYTRGIGVTQFPDLDNFFRQAVDPQWQYAHGPRARQAAEYLLLLETVYSPHYTEDQNLKPLIAGNENFRQAKKARDAKQAISSFIGTDSFTNDDGSVKTTDPRWQTIEECANYWNTERAAAALRVPHVQALTGMGDGANPTILKRLVSLGEKNSIVNLRHLNQGVNGHGNRISYERHKWFYCDQGNRGGAPGVGHPWLVEIELKGNHWNALINLAVEVGEQQADSRQAFIRKANEADCIGIHEDVLVPFHPLIKEFKIRQAGQRGGRVETVQPR